MGYGVLEKTSEQKSYRLRRERERDALVSYFGKWYSDSGMEI